MTPAQITEEQRAPCCICGKMVDTREIDPDDMPEDLDACELSDGRWTCSSACYERAVLPDPISAAEARGYARGLEEAAKRCDAAAEAMAALLARHPDSLVALYSGDMARDLADGLRALSPSPAQKED